MEDEADAEVGGQAEIGPGDAPEAVAQLEGEQRGILGAVEGEGVGLEPAFGGHRRHRHLGDELGDGHLEFADENRDLALRDFFEMDDFDGEEGADFVPDLERVAGGGSGAGGGGADGGRHRGGQGAAVRVDEVEIEAA